MKPLNSRHLAMRNMDPRRWVSLAMLTVATLGTSVGCSHDTTGPGLTDAAHLYYQLVLNHHAITLALTAPYDHGR